MRPRRAATRLPPGSDSPSDVPPAPRAALTRLLALCALAAVTACTLPSSAPSAPLAAGGFAFAAIGDMPYAEGQVPVVDGLLADMDADPQVDFVIHVGDLKGGGERCDDALLESRHRQLQALRKPWLYTPGDNEWTDCHRAAGGRYLPTERLAFLRRLFFPQPGRSGGTPPLALDSQASMAGHEPYVENSMFVHRRVLVATLHVPGSRNGLEPWLGIDPADSDARPRPDRAAEVRAREAAALAWLDRAFRRARAADAIGVVLAFHANPGFERGAGSAPRTGFEPLLQRLRQHVQAFGRPVLVVHGDHHQLIVDRPWAGEAAGSGGADGADAAAAGSGLRRLQRVQVYGHPWLYWVKLRVDPASPDVFAVEPRSAAPRR